MTHNHQYTALETDISNAPKLSPEPNKAIQEMMDIIDALRHVMEEETSVLEASDARGFLEIQDRKFQAYKDYQSGVQQMLDNKDAMKAAHQSLRQRLEDMRINFQKTAQTNTDAIERMQKGMQRLGDRIMSSARENAKKEQQLVYSAQGHMEDSKTTTIGIRESA